MSVLLVDWLGRGGIAQTTAAWSKELECAGIAHAVVSRPGRELAGALVLHPPPRRSRLLQHLLVVRAAVTAIAERRPEVVVIQNHLIPPLEITVDRAARRFGSTVVRVVHDHVLHSRAAGIQVALDRALRAADVVLAHSEFVASHVERRTGASVVVVPLPLFLDGVADERHLPAELAALRPLASQFGVVHRNYKGVELTTRLASRGVPSWHFALLGAGADPGPGLVAIDRYIEAAQLAAAVAASAVSLFPYRFATQSGGVCLAQSLGSVPLATAVGGIPEQILNGVTGVLLPPDADLDRWAHALEELSDEARRTELAQNGRQKAIHDHQAFSAAVVALARGLVPS
jgi:glycosyltransferase involved in cell wall biosynthesis